MFQSVAPQHSFGFSYMSYLWSCLRTDTFDTPPNLELSPDVLIVIIVPPGSLVPCCRQCCWCHCLGHWDSWCLLCVQGLLGFRLCHCRGRSRVGGGSRCYRYLCHVQSCRAHEYCHCGQLLAGVG